MSKIELESYNEEFSDRRMSIIGQNGNTGKHYLPSHSSIKIIEKELPDAGKHQIISFIKSGIRIVGYAFIPYSLEIATILLIFSELVGIVEELV